MSSRTEKIIFGVLLSVIVLLGGVRLFMDGGHVPTSEQAEEMTKKEKEKNGEQPQERPGDTSTSASLLSDEGISGQNEQEKASSSAPNRVTVYVGGAVKNPGLYTFDDQKRVADALQAAGNLTENGALGSINPAQRLSDEMNIVVPTKEEASQGKTQGAEPSQLGVTVPKKESGTATASSNPTRKININTATAEELQQLPSIGKAKAENILRYREKTPFQTEEDIKKVSGIGKKVYEQIQQQICVK